MNKLRPIKAIGCPWHGLCLNDVYELGPTPYPTVASRPAGATFGPAIPIVHPNNPGAGVLVNGTDRFYGLYVGHTRSINGADGGTGIGWNRWLYCDPVTDATWLMRLEHTDNVTDVDLEVWCDGVFGRSGRDYTVAPRLVQSFTWTPDIPSWAGAGDTAANAVSQLQWGSHVQLAISQDGSEVWLHLFTTPGGVSGGMYTPTCETGHNWGLLSGNAVCSIVKITVAGSNTAAELGAAITATIAKDLPYENTGAGGMVSGYTDTVDTFAHDTIFYRSDEGDCTRDYTYTKATDAFSVQYDLWGEFWSNSGIAVTQYGSGTEFKIFAQNAIYLATYKEGVTDNVFDQRWTVLDLLKNPETPWTLQNLSTYAAASSGFHEMPYTRRWVASFEPANPTFSWQSADAVYLTPYAGTTYQYI